jgi:hypothetical protein
MTFPTEWKVIKIIKIPWFQTTNPMTMCPIHVGSSDAYTRCLRRAAAVPNGWSPRVWPPKAARCLRKIPWEDMESRGRFMIISDYLWLFMYICMLDCPLVTRWYPSWGATKKCPPKAEVPIIHGDTIILGSRSAPQISGHWWYNWIRFG